VAGATYTVQLKPAAERNLKKIKDKAVLRRIAKAIEGLQTNPKPTAVKALQGNDSIFRIRVGDYRILYTIEDRARVVLVIRIGHRREIYRDR
jgi:mRNA interferase RelE/StbE